ncbi:ClpXP protease specificity-enhancing factor [Moraxella sp. ZJ142]|uniref:ClpXP protease specificity-enhancing factor n=1 Tax=Moraxella marmotae TaxID=3344520 RepID=UPI0035D4DFF7
MTTPKRPYIVRAFHEWIEDNDYTPYLMIDATHPDVVAPLEYAQEGRLVLAASYQATHNLQIDNDAISFDARFGGISRQIWIPMPALMAIYAKEDPEHGAFFDPNEYADYADVVADDTNKAAPKPASKKGSALRVLD